MNSRTEIEITLDDILEWSDATKFLVEASCGKHGRDKINLEAIVLALLEVQSANTQKAKDKFDNICHFLHIIPPILVKGFHLYNHKIVKTLGNDYILTELSKTGLDVLSKQSEIDYHQLIPGIDNDDLTLYDTDALVEYDYRFITLFPQALTGTCDIAAFSYLKSEPKSSTYYYDSPEEYEELLTLEQDKYVKLMINKCSPKMVKKLLKRNGLFLQYIPNPPKDYFEIAFSDDPRIAYFYDNLEENYYIRAVNEMPSMILNLKNPSDNTYMVAIAQGPELMVQIPNLKESIQVYLVSLLHLDELITINNNFQPLIVHLCDQDWLATKAIDIILDNHKYNYWHDLLKSHKNYVSLAQRILNEIKQP